jgi:hypothetical protein
MPASFDDSILQLSISTQNIHTASHFKLLLRLQNMNPRPSPSPKHGKMPNRVTALAFDLCVLYYIAAHVSYSSLSSKISGTEDDCKSNSTVFIGSAPSTEGPACYNGPASLAIAAMAALGAGMTAAATAAASTPVS